MKVRVSFTLDIDVNEWEGRHRGIPVDGVVDVHNPTVYLRITNQVREHAENVVRALYEDQGWARPETVDA